MNYAQIKTAHSANKKDFYIFWSIIFCLTLVVQGSSFQFLKLWVENSFSFMAGDLAAYPLEEIEHFSPQSIVLYTMADYIAITSDALSVINYFNNHVATGSPKLHRDHVLAMLTCLWKITCYLSWADYLRIIFKVLQPITPLALFYRVETWGYKNGVDNLDYPEFIRQGFWSTIEVIFFNDQEDPKVILRALDAIILVFIDVSSPIITFEAY